MAMKIFNVQDALGSADFNEYAVNTKYAVKPSGTTRASNNTPTIDPDLQMQVDANKSYMIEVFLLYNSDSAANFQYRFNAPAGSALYGIQHAEAGFVGGGGSQTGIYTPFGNLPILYNTQINLAGNAPTSDAVARISGVLNTAGTAGGFSVAWAQNTSTAFTTILRTGSFMLVKRVS